MNFKRDAIIRLVGVLATGAFLSTAGIYSCYKQREKGQRIAENIISFRATVRSVKPLNQINEQTILAHFDPRFALELDIDSACPDSKLIQSGDKVILAIHSPSKLFLGDDPVGKTFFFSAEKNQKKQVLQFVNLTAKTQIK
jgi:hypothetical protein